MGLDMYLERMPRYGNTTPHEIGAIESYFDWKENSEAKKYSMEKWCGIPFKDVPPKNVRDFYAPFYTTTYYEWDDKHEFPHKGIKEEIGYWRKANQIHNWFVENVQDGEDDCHYHDEVTKEVLEELLATCQKVLDSCEMVEGQICVGYTFENGRMIPTMKNGKCIKDPSVAMELLPTTSGFFFGCIDYDEYYLEDIKHTIEVCKNALETTDFETQQIFYVSSW